MALRSGISRSAKAVALLIRLDPSGRRPLLRDRRRPSATGGSEWREDTAGKAAGVLAVLDDKTAVDEDVLDADGVAMGIVVGCPISHRARIEDDEIGASADAHGPPVTQAKTARRKPRHLVDRLGQREEPLLPCVLAEYTREGAVAAWVRLARAHLAVRRQGGAIGADHDVGMHEGPAQILFVELEEDHRRLPGLVGDQLEGGVQRIHSTGGRDLGQALTLGVLPSRAVRDHDVVPADAIE